MKINNIEAVEHKFSCRKSMANYLIKKGFMPLSEKDSVYYFSKNKNIEKALEDAPFYLKMLKGGE